MARTYTIGFKRIAVSAVQDFVSIRCAATCLVKIVEVRLAQTLSVTSTQVAIRHRKATATFTLGSVGSVPTAVKHESGDAAAASTFRVNDTTQGTTTGAFTDFEDAFNFLSGYLWVPTPEEWITLAPGEGYVLDAPLTPASGTYSGSVTFMEIG